MNNKNTHQAACLACQWKSLDYQAKGWAVKSADKHQRLYHAGQSTIIRITSN